MGNCISSVHCHSSRMLADIYDKCRTGDVVYIIDDSKSPSSSSSRYLLKAAEGWVSAAKVGFLLRLLTPAGDEESLHFVHADESAGPLLCRVVATPLAIELQRPDARLAVVRHLHKPLTQQQIDLIHEYVTLNLNKIVPEEPSPSTVLMASTAVPSTKTFERLSCSDFVATMLHLVGLVEPTGLNSGEFAATDRNKGRVMGCCVTLRLRGGAGTMASSTQAGIDLRSPRFSDGGMSSVRSSISTERPDPESCPSSPLPPGPTRATHGSFQASPPRWPASAEKSATENNQHYSRAVAAVS